MQKVDLCGSQMNFSFGEYGQINASISDGILTVTINSYEGYFIENVKLHVAGKEGFPTVGKGNLPPGQMSINRDLDSGTNSHTFTFNLVDFEISQNENSKYYLSIASLTTFERGETTVQNWTEDLNGQSGNWFYFNYDLAVCCQNIVNVGPDKMINAYAEDFNPADYTAARLKRYLENNLLDPNATEGGTYSPDFFGAFGLDYNLNRGATELIIVSTVGEGECKDSATLSLILQP